jgi:hypothetical protein
MYQYSAEIPTRLAFPVIQPCPDRLRPRQSVAVHSWNVALVEETRERPKI